MQQDGGRKPTAKRTSAFEAGSLFRKEKELASGEGANLGHGPSKVIDLSHV